MPAPATTATTLVEYRQWLHKLSHGSVGASGMDAKQRAPYLCANTLPPAAVEAFREMDRGLARTQLRIPQRPKVTLKAGELRYVRVNTEHGHRSAFAMAYSELPKPLLFDRRQLGGPRAYWQVMGRMRELLSTAQAPLFFRIDLRKAYLNITGDLVVAAYDAIHQAAGVDVGGRRYERKRAALSTHLTRHADDLFLQSRQQRSLYLGNPASHWLANWVYTAIVADCEADAALRFEDDIILIHRADKRKSLQQHWQSHMHMLDRWEQRIAPEKVESGRMGQDPLTFLGHHWARQRLTITEEKLAHRLGRTLAWIEAYTQRQGATPSMALLMRQHRRFLGYYKAVTDRQALLHGLAAHTRRQLRLVLAADQGAAYSQACALLPNDRLAQSA